MVNLSMRQANDNVAQTVNRAGSARALRIAAQFLSPTSALDFQGGPKARARQEVRQVSIHSPGFYRGGS